MSITETKGARTLWSAVMRFAGETEKVLSVSLRAAVPLRSPYLPKNLPKLYQECA